MTPLPLRDRLVLLFHSPGFDQEPVTTDELSELTCQGETLGMLEAALDALAEEGTIERQRAGYRLAPRPDAPATERPRARVPVDARIRFALMDRSGRPASAAEIARETSLGQDEVFLALEDLADDRHASVRRVAAGYYAWEPPKNG